MDIKEVIKVVYSKKNSKLIMRKHLGDIIVNKKKIGSISTNLAGLGVLIEIDNNMIALDTDKFISYVVNNLEELINNYDKQEIKS